MVRILLKLVYHDSYICHLWFQIRIVKLCVHFCVCVSKSLRKWTQTDPKVTFHPPPTTTTHHPPENFFWSYMKGSAKIRLLVPCYGTNFAPIKRYCLFCFLYKEAQILACLSFLAVCSSKMKNNFLFYSF